MKLLSILCLLTAPLLAQNAEPFDTKAARSTLSEATVKPRFIPKSATVVSRTYTKNAKGLTVEVTTLSNDEKIERPYVPVPILFVVGTDELLDDVSRANVGELARILKDLIAEGSKFTIQGHTSVEGTEEANQRLSDLRAVRIRSLLTSIHGLDPARLQAIGFGENFAAIKDERAPDAQRQHDRRVLVVRD